jgi:arylsulfatase A-like enzyme
MKRDNWEGGHRVPLLVRWPLAAKPSVIDQTVCLTDLLATCAALSDTALPRNAGEDSFSFLAALTGVADQRPQRPFTLHQTIKSELSIRRGEWKYLDHRGSGGNSYEKGALAIFALPDTAPTAPGQLYNLKTDPGERTNLYLERPEIVKELKGLLDQSKTSGRSAP